MVFGYLQFAYSYDYRIWPPKFYPGFSGRFSGFMGSYLSIASTFIFPYFLMIECLADKKVWYRPILAVFVCFGLIALFGTQARMFWMAFPVGLLLFVLIRYSWKQVMLLILGLSGLIVCFYYTPGMNHRLHSIGGFAERWTLWQINWEFFKMRPLTGIGWHHNLQMSHAYYLQFMPDHPNQFVGHAHSNFFEWIGGLGLIGLIGGLYWSGTVLMLTWRVSLGLFCAWVVFQLNGVTQVNFWESKTIHSMMWAVSIALTLVLRASGLEEKRHEREGNPN